MKYIEMENKKHPYFKCGRCKNQFIKKQRYLWIGLITKQKLYICRDCAYKESYGTKGSPRAKKEKWLENNG